MKKQYYIISVLCILYSSTIIAQTQSLGELFNAALHKEKSGDFQTASQLYQTIISAYPTCTQALYNYAHTLKDLGAMHEAINAYKQVILQEPNNTFARFGLGQCYGALGMLEQAFPLLENRGSAIKEFSREIECLRGRYAQSAPMTGIIILLRAEWGFGDIIQFIRYAQLLHDRGATIIVQTYQELAPLLSMCPFLDRVIRVGDAFPHHTVQLPLLSLPYVCAITRETCTPAMPYLKADEGLCTQWKNYLSSYKTFTIGICWQGKGDPHAPPLLNKNIPLQELTPLLHVSGVTVLSLQKTGANTTPMPGLITFDESFDQAHGRFMDTAALMQNLDVIITVDTSIAHLAGALNKPVWLLAPCRTDWRWGLRETTSAFYPSMHIFRQDRPGDWHGVIQNVIQEIKKII